MITRFAPSPTGPLHLGHAYSALRAFDLARQQSGRFLLRIEDIDTQRSRSIWETQIYEDLKWLGLAWENPVLRQSDNLAAYDAALTRLDQLGVLYRCTCTRRDITQAISAPQEGANGPDGVIYPGTCRHANHGCAKTPFAMRLDMSKALQAVDNVSYTELSTDIDQTLSFDTDHMIKSIGDVVLARRDIGTSYHLSVVVDDAATGISHVVRGQDLASATPIHVLLQKLLHLPTPQYLHHRLIRDEDGKRLAKRDNARAIRAYRDAGLSPANVRQLVGL